MERSKGDLKPLQDIDTAQADYAVIATDETGATKGQCLLFNAAGGADRVAPYNEYLKETPSNSLILTSLSGRKAIPKILDTIQTSSMLAGLSLCAKRKAENTVAKDFFENANFISEGPTLSLIHI